MVETVDIAVIGAGPAGLMAAETLAAAGRAPVIYEAMPTPARKFLMAGKSGLNITHASAFESFAAQYGTAKEMLLPALNSFAGDEVRAWAEGLGVETFVGSSGRVFPTAMKASPLLRAWLKRLSEMGATLKTRHQWLGFGEDGVLNFQTPEGALSVKAKATVLALGGASWPKLGSDGAWVKILQEQGVEPKAFLPANCGFNCDWSDIFKDRFAGEPVKSIRLSVGDVRVKGDFVISSYGVEGSAVYGVSAPLRDGLASGAKLMLDLMPDKNVEAITRALSKPRGKKSFSTFIKRVIGLSGVKAGLLRECVPNVTSLEAQEIAANIKEIALPVTETRPIAEAISVAGGVPFDSVTEDLMLKALPGVFCAGEMMDWEAPTGGYLITGCMAEGKQAAEGVARWLEVGA